tara:strand:+ start:642 stop:1793 length:1152 start_codon:yes stop_codon:yes gene_type:complete
MSKAAELANLIGNINAGGGGVNRNVIINGNMNVAQRQVSSTGLGGSDGYFTCDRWRHVFNTSGRLTSTQDSSAPSGFANSLKFACTTADTSIAAGEYMFLSQRIEGQNVQAFAKGTSDAKPFAVSFWVKGNASATYVCELYDSDNTRQISKTFNVTTDWTRIELSFPADTTGALDDDNARSFDLTIWLHAGTTYTSGTLNSSAWASNTNANRAVGISSFFDSTDRTFFLTGVQLEVGQNPTEFEHEPFAVTRHKCLRFYEHNYEAGYYPADGVNYANTASPFLGNCYHDSGGGGKYILTYHKFEVEKRASPTTTMYRVAGLGNGSTANRWDWFNYSGGWDETDGNTEGGEISSQHHGALARDTGAGVDEALNIAGGWEADAEL